MMRTDAHVWTASKDDAGSGKDIGTLFGVYQVLPVCLDIQTKYKSDMQ